MCVCVCVCVCVSGVLHCGYCTETLCKTENKMECDHLLIIFDRKSIETIQRQYILMFSLSLIDSCKSAWSNLSHCETHGRIKDVTTWAFIYVFKKRDDFPEKCGCKSIRREKMEEFVNKATGRVSVIHILDIVSCAQQEKR